MPLGVSWTRYLSFCAAAMFSMFAGAQTVHNFYKPLNDLDVYVEEEMKKHLGSNK